MKSRLLLCVGESWDLIFLEIHFLQSSLNETSPSLLLTRRIVLLRESNNPFFVCFGDKFVVFRLKREQIDVLYPLQCVYADRKEWKGE